MDPAFDQGKFVALTDAVIATLKEEIERLELAKRVASEEPNTAIFHLRATMSNLGGVVEEWKRLGRW